MPSGNPWHTHKPPAQKGDWTDLVSCLQLRRRRRPHPSYRNTSLCVQSLPAAASAFVFAQSGERQMGETAVIGYFQQHPPEVGQGLRLIDYIR